MIFHVRKYLIPEKFSKIQQEEVARHCKAGLETGGYEIGKIYQNGVCEITDVIYAGPDAKKSGGSFSPDNEHASKRKEEIQSQDQNKRVANEWHLHPWSGEPHPSGIDHRQLIESKKERPWYGIHLYSEDQDKFFDLDDNEQLAEVPHQVIPDNFDLAGLSSRQAEIVDGNKLASSNVAIIGLGTLGSAISLQLGCVIGIGRFTLCDMELFEAANVSRHVGTIYDIGKKKTDICKNLIESHNPFAVIEMVEEDLLSDKEVLRKVIKEATVVVAASGNPKLNAVINRICLEEKRSAVYGGIFEKASGAYVLGINDSSRACFDCLFGITNTVDSKYVARKYGFEPEDLKAQQGLWMQVSYPAIKMSEFTLKILQGQKIENNLVVYNNNFDAKKLPVGKGQCATCNYENWLKNEEEKIKSKTAKKKNGFLERVKRLKRK